MIANDTVASPKLAGWPSDSSSVPFDDNPRVKIERDLTTARVAVLTRDALLKAAADSFAMFRVDGHLVLVVVFTYWLRLDLLYHYDTSLVWRDTCRRLVSYKIGNKCARAVVAHDRMLLAYGAGTFLVEAPDGTPTPTLIEIPSALYQAELQRLERRRRLAP